MDQSPRTRRTTSPWRGGGEESPLLRRPEPSAGTAAAGWFTRLLSAAVLAMALLLIHKRVRFGLSKKVIRRWVGWTPLQRQLELAMAAVILKMKSQCELSVLQPLRLMLTG